MLGWSTERYLTESRAPASPEFVAGYDALIERRAQREPTAYILRRQEFWGLDFEVAPAVLIPRPETELVVESALAVCAPDTGPLIADLCTGSGCIAVAIAVERPQARLAATDISDAALDIGRRNAARHLVSERIAFLRADLLAGMDTFNTAPFDLIVANPPYVRRS